MTDQTQKRKPRVSPDIPASETKPEAQQRAQAEPKDADPNLKLHKTADGLTLAVRTF